MPYESFMSLYCYLIESKIKLSSYYDGYLNVHQRYVLYIRRRLYYDQKALLLNSLVSAFYFSKLSSLLILLSLIQ